MAQNVIFLSTKTLDEATIVEAPNFLAAAPATQTQNRQPRKTAQSDGLDDVYIVWDLGSAIALNTFAAVRGNFTADATWEWSASSDVNDLLGTTPTPELTLGEVSVWPATGKPSDLDWDQHTNLLVTANATAKRYWRADFFDAANPETMIELGRLASGIRWQPPINFTFDWGMRFEPADIVIETVFGMTQTEDRLRPRALMLPFDSIRRAEVFAQAATLQRLRGRAGQIVCCLDYSETTDLHWSTMLGVLKEMGEIGQKFGDIYTARFQLREVL